MKKLIDETDILLLREQIEAVVSLAAEAGTVPELVELEKQCGIGDFVGMSENWDDLFEYLIKLHSPFAEVISALLDRWDDLMSLY